MRDLSPTFTKASETLPSYLLGKDGKFGTESMAVYFLAQVRERAASLRVCSCSVTPNSSSYKEGLEMPKGKRTNEPVKVVAHSVRYGVQEDHLQTSISGFEIRQQDEPPAVTNSCITVEFGPTVSKTSAITALRMVLEKIEAEWPSRAGDENGKTNRDPSRQACKRMPLKLPNCWRSCHLRCAIT